jgi:hypothetical protein
MVRRWEKRWRMDCERVEPESPLCRQVKTGAGLGAFVGHAFVGLNAWCPADNCTNEVGAFRVRARRKSSAWPERHDAMCSYRRDTTSAER